MANRNEIKELLEDELLLEAIEIVLESGKFSFVPLQSKLKIGFARAMRLIEKIKALNQALQLLSDGGAIEDSSLVKICKAIVKYNQGRKPVNGQYLIRNDMFEKLYALITLPSPEKPKCGLCKDTGQVGKEQTYHGRSVGFKACPECEDEQPSEPTGEFVKRWRKLLNPEELEKKKSVIFICVGDMEDALDRLEQAEKENELLERRITNTNPICPLCEERFEAGQFAIHFITQCKKAHEALVLINPKDEVVKQLQSSLSSRDGLIRELYFASRAGGIAKKFFDKKCSEILGAETPENILKEKNGKTENR